MYLDTDQEKTSANSWGGTHRISLFILRTHIFHLNTVQLEEYIFDYLHSYHLLADHQNSTDNTDSTLTKNPLMILNTCITHSPRHISPRNH